MEIPTIRETPLHSTSTQPLLVMKRARESRPSQIECPYCARVFSRQEHLERHVHTHTKTKPFTCEVCQKGFGRQDVYRRHLKTQHPDQVSLLTNNKKRIQAACDNCHKRKLKCNWADHPCERCLREGADCTFLRTGSDQTEDNLSEHRHSLLGQPLSPDTMAWHPENYESPQEPFSLPSVNEFPFREESFMENLTPGLLEFDFMATVPSFDFRILDQLPPFPSLELLPTSNPAQGSLGSHSSRIEGAFTKLHAFSSPADISRPESPTARIEYENWLHRLGQKQRVQYDPLILQVFLNLFRVHVVPTFRCFEGFLVTEATPVELWAAMGSIGALHCTTPGSMKFAESLYNHARIELLSKVHHRIPSPNDDPLAIVQTYMLLELFGYLSGKSRYHEIAEVYHWEMIQVIGTYNLWSTSCHEWETQRKRTIEGICILECYRVTILHGAATFSPVLPILSELTATPPSPRGIGGPTDDVLLAQLRRMMSRNVVSPRFEYMASNTEITSIWSLCCLSLLLPWAAINSTRTTDRPAEEILRRGEVLESALNNWFLMSSDQASTSTMMLFHLICLNLHVSETKIQDLARREGGHSPSTSSTTSGDRISSESAFASEVNRRNAIWHAKRIIHLAWKLKQHDETVTLWTEGGPHFSHCVFFAALTLWYAAWRPSSLNPGDEGPRRDMHRTSSPLTLAIKVLSTSPTQIGRNFVSTLQCLPGVD